MSHIKEESLWNIKGLCLECKHFLQKANTLICKKWCIYIKQQAGQMKQKEKRSRYCTKHGGLFFGEFQWFLAFCVVLHKEWPEVNLKSFHCVLFWCFYTTKAWIVLTWHFVSMLLLLNFREGFRVAHKLSDLNSKCISLYSLYI